MPLSPNLQQIQTWRTSGRRGQYYAQDGADLYIGGGYGENHLGKWVTFPLISRVNVPALIDGVMRGHLPADAISSASTPDVRVAGGALRSNFPMVTSTS